MTDDGRMNRPLFDGRMQYHELLGKLLTEGKKFSIYGDVVSQYRVLHEMYNMVCAYIDAESAQLIKIKLMKVRKEVLYFSQHNFISGTERDRFRQKLDLLLLDLEEDLHRGARYVFLPLTDGEGGIDIEKYYRLEEENNGIIGKGKS